MSRFLMYALLVPLLAAEIWAELVAHDRQLTVVFAVIALGVLAVRWVLGPTADEAPCPRDCRKCWEDEL
jgi:hypothetical protein